MPCLSRVREQIHWHPLGMCPIHRPPTTHPRLFFFGIGRVTHKILPSYGKAEKVASAATLGPLSDEKGSGPTRKCHSLSTALISNLIVERRPRRLPRGKMAALVFLGAGVLWAL